MVSTWSLSDATLGSTCEPFAIDRQNSVCAEALAAGSYPNCSSLNVTLQRLICEVYSLDDLDNLLEVARVLGHNDVSMQIRERI